MPLEPGYLVQVYTTDKQGDRYIGTGYSISVDLVLTARHVVIGDDLDITKGIELVWLDGDKAKHDVTLGQGDILFPGSDEYDVAVLKLPEPVPFEVATAELCGVPPKPDDRWNSEGFPVVARDGDSFDRISMLGSIAGNAVEGVFQVTPDTMPADKGEWAGYSGAPLFSPVDRQISGVMVTDYRSMERCLQVHSLQSLLDDSGFRECFFGEGVDSEFLREQEAEMITLLKDDKVMVGVFNGLKKLTEKRHTVSGECKKSWLVDTLTTEMRRGDLTFLNDYYQVVGKILVTEKKRGTVLDEDCELWQSCVQLLARMSLFSVPGQDIYFNRQQQYTDIPAETALGMDLYLAVLGAYVPELTLQKSDVRNPHSFGLVEESGWQDNDEFDIAFRQIWFAVEKNEYPEVEIRARDIAFLNDQLELARNHPFLPRKLALIATAAESEWNPLFGDDFYLMLQDKLSQLIIGRERRVEGLSGFSNEAQLRSRVVTFLRLIEEINQL